MDYITNVTSSPFQDQNTSELNKINSEIKTRDNEIETIKELIEKIKDDKELLNYTITQLSEKVGSYTLEKMIDTIRDKENDNEPILSENMRKFTALPIQYQNIWKKYKEQLASFWKAEEIDFSNDYNDFLTLNDNEKYFVEMILAFFAASDGIVNFNLSERFTKDVKNTEILFTYQFQTMMENVHSETYSLMLDNIVKDPHKKQFLFNAIKNVESVKLMADWAFKWIESSKSFSYRVIAFAIVEAVFFSGAFAAIFWLKKYKNKNRDASKGTPFMDGLIKSNKFISRDEGMHAAFACEVYSLLKNKLPQSEVNEILKEGVIVSQKFMTDALPVKLIGMSSQSMCDYIEYIGDRLLVMLGYKKIYNKKNPFKFMETIGLNDKTNFFESRPHEYQDAHIMNKGNKSTITINDEF
ncbi:ribonucleoside diphosphate reductase small subunit [Fadolivirus algeromassiliense]|jgi:ribonucleotide reductase beta subunit family protein with ferritin-like domain|uniref:Ribonucleoside-diphosphate reductase small chain n=1 Tax=Fadolivirus FV1/VV64 TaxID=3070911 RepID=A0A7D3UU15_9VIRU|nr:ribonucleoside diphosphate reductase small subunit [Fadolivirus algeromassiliense]QKF93831.1 ribonucleoside diphosphate reductase small subunit [Fadolivirus FV1/VV64]